ncbi:MAG TPA: DUF481 domain-containing protein [Edaphocola sp.]|nr:DUF481 domain-containing protein [Edaphocola sp.]
MLRKIVFLFLLILISSHTLWAQFNDSVHFKTTMSLSGNFNKTSEGLTMLFNNGVGFGIKYEDLEVNSSGKWLYGKNPQQLTNNDWTASADFDFNTEHKPLNLWGLFNFSSSYSLNVNYKYQSGIGFVYKFFDSSDFKLSISDGILYDYSSVNTSNTDKLEYETYRNSLRVKASYNFNQKIKSNLVFYHQPSLNLKNDYIISSNLNLSFKIWKWINFNTGLTYNKNSKTDKENLIMTYGIVSERFF